jgi:mannose-6-phosphate isomerase
MDRIRALRNPIRHYAWGSREAIARWSGRPAPSEQPEAELWLGAHPNDPSRVLLDDAGATAEPLDARIARDPAASLGARVAERFGGELPFLLKVLAPERALSIQTHPDAERACRGYAREDAAGLAPDDPRRSYRDRRAKPELICALTQFSALCDLRERNEAAPLLRALQLEALAEVVETAGSAAGLHSLLELSEATKRAIAERVAATVVGARDPAFELVGRLCAQHPGDIGVLAPLFMNFIELAPGEALFLEAGHIHAYLRGLGVELMGNSDNTLRGGLTPRHLDIPEFLAALDPSEGAPRRLTPSAGADGVLRYAAPTPAFELRRFELTAGHSLARTPGDGPEIWLCTSGRAQLHDTRHDASFALPAGSSVWVPATAGPFEVTGDAVFHVAAVPM